MIKLKISIITILLFLLSPLSFGQEVKLYTDKENYEIYEKIELKLEINIEVDSLELFDHPQFKNFKLTAWPKKRSKISSMLNEKNTFLYKWTYILRSEKLGKMPIVSPTFYSKGNKIIGIEKYIEITKSDLNYEELQDFIFHNFIEDPIKPNGTLVYIFNGNFGYIKKVEGKKTVFYRKMTKEELELLKKIK